MFYIVCGCSCLMCRGCCVHEDISTSVSDNIYQRELTIQGFTEEIQTTLTLKTCDNYS